MDSISNTSFLLASTLVLRSRGHVRKSVFKVSFYPQFGQKATSLAFSTFNWFKKKNSAELNDLSTVQFRRQSLIHTTRDLSRPWSSTSETTFVYACISFSQPESSELKVIVEEDCTGRVVKYLQVLKLRVSFILFQQSHSSPLCCGQ